jgi:hypothetical protein
MPALLREIDNAHCAPQKRTPQPPRKTRYILQQIKRISSILYFFWLYEKKD